MLKGSSLYHGDIPKSTEDSTVGFLLQRDTVSFWLWPIGPIPYMWSL